MPTTKLRFLSFKQKSRIWWVASLFPDTGQQEEVSVLQSTTMNHPGGFIEKTLRTGFYELHRPEVHSLQNLQFQFHSMAAYSTILAKRREQYNNKT